MSILAWERGRKIRKEDAKGTKLCERCAPSSSLRPNQLILKTESMKKFLLAGIAILVVAILPFFQSCKTSSGTTGERLLKFNLQQGKTYDYEMVSNMEQEVMGRKFTINMSSLYSISVINDDGKVKTLTGTYRNFKMDLDIMGSKISVDTDKPLPPAGDNENPMDMPARIFSGIAGKTFTMKVNEEGDVMEVTGFREILQSMVDSVKADDNTRQQMMATLRDQFNEQSVKDNFAQAFFIFPNKKIKVGDSWQKTYSMGGKTPAKHTTTYKVREMDADIVTIMTETEISSSGGEMQTKGSQKGNIIVDSKSGLMINGEFNMQMQVNAQGTTVDMTGTGTVKGKERN